jgi:hypothetical protein
MSYLVEKMNEAAEYNNEIAVTKEVAVKLCESLIASKIDHKQVCEDSENCFGKNNKDPFRYYKIFDKSGELRTFAGAKVNTYRNNINRFSEDKKEIFGSGMYRSEAAIKLKMNELGLDEG